MNEYLDKALEKLRGAKAPTGQREAVVFKPVVAALEDFCRQDAEFAQAGGTGRQRGGLRQDRAEGRGRQPERP